MLKKNQLASLSLSYDYLRVAVNYLQRLGIDEQSCLIETGIANILAEPNPESPEQSLVTIDINQYRKLVESLKKLSQQPEIGILLGQQYNISTHGNLGQVALCSQNIWEAVALVTKYTELRNHLLSMEWRRENAMAVLEFSTHLEATDLQQYAMEVAMSTMNRWLRFCLKSVESSPAMIEMHFSHPEPSYVETYRKVLRCPILFDQPSYQIKLPLDICFLPLRCANTTLFKLIEKQCEVLLANLSENNLVDTIRRILLSNPANLPSQDEIAVQLNMAPRTLRKYLKEQATSYQQILDQVRCELAQTYLADSQWSIEDIANLLGFSDRYHFSSAFKKWLGITPAAFRKTE